MEVILREDIAELGRSGDVVDVKDGYARNYLIPQSLAIQATRRNLKQLEHQKRVIAKRAERKRAEAATLSERMQDLSITVSKPVGGSDRLYGSVTPRDIIQGLSDEGVQGISRKQVQLDFAIRQLGIYSVPIRLTADHSVDIKVWVVAKE